MKLVTMVQDVLPSLLRAPITEKYPFERHPEPQRLRSLLAWDRESCTGCGMCATDCPSQAIELVVFDKKAKSIVFGLHVDRCTFCGQCTFSCKQGSLVLENDHWELASLDRGNLLIHFGQANDVQDVLAGVTSRPSVPPPPAEGRGEATPPADSSSTESRGGSAAPPAETAGG